MDNINDLINAMKDDPDMNRRIKQVTDAMNAVLAWADAHPEDPDAKRLLELDARGRALGKELTIIAGQHGDLSRKIYEEKILPQQNIRQMEANDAIFLAKLGIKGDH